MMIKKLVLIGVGLIGGSLALDLKKIGYVEEVVGVDVDADNLTRALERKVIDSASQHINADVMHAADVILIATPVGTLSAICQQLRAYLSSDMVITDVGSTKQSALHAFSTALPEHFPNCVAAHPIAGSDRSGALAAQFGLFNGKKCIICPHEQQNVQSLERVKNIWQAAGAELYMLPAIEHDTTLASVSHLPHLLAYAFMNQIGRSSCRELLLRFAGSGFRDFTRIAGSDPTVWADICLANRESLQQLLMEQKEQLDFLQNCLNTADKSALIDYFQVAKLIRNQWSLD